MSNETKSMFKNFCNKHGLERTSNIHGVHINDKRFIYQVPKDGKVDCRQFYDGFDGIIVDSGESYRTIEKTKLVISKKPTRISPSGISAYNVFYDLGTL